MPKVWCTHTRRLWIIGERGEGLLPQNSLAIAIIAVELILFSPLGDDHATPAPISLFYAAAERGDRSTYSLHWLTDWFRSFVRAPPAIQSISSNEQRAGGCEGRWLKGGGTTFWTVGWVISFVFSVLTTYLSPNSQTEKKFEWMTRNPCDLP